MGEPSRLGVSDDGVFVFTCARCRGVAARLALDLEAAEVGLGSGPGGREIRFPFSGPTWRLEFLGTGAGLASPELIQLLRDQEVVDPVAVRNVDWDRGAFNCRVCSQNYCAECWRTFPTFDDGFYDETIGICPEGHQQSLDD